MTRTVSPAGRAALMAREGCRLSAYRDSVGVPTIGVGHTGRAAPPTVEMGMTITRGEADSIFAADLAPFEAVVSAAVPASLTQNQFDACVSLAFNIGPRGFAGSTVVHRLAAGDRAGAAEAFLMWNHPPELLGRRRAERAQFLTPDGRGIASDPAAPVLDGIILALNAAARPAPSSATAPAVMPITAGPHLLPPARDARPWWKRLLDLA